MAEEEARLRLVEDKLAISDVLYRYASGLDSQDWEAWQQIFAEEAVFDIRSSGTKLMGITKPKPTPREKAAPRVTFAGLATTQHLLGNHRYLNIDRDPVTGNGTARVTSTMRAEHWCPQAAKEGVGGDRYTMFGYYDDRLIRDGKTGQWLLTEVQLNVTRTEGNPAVMKVATQLGKERLFKDEGFAKRLQGGGKAAWEARQEVKK